MKLTKSDQNQSLNASREKTAKVRSSLINNCLAQLGTALGQTPTKDLKEVFCVGLADLTESQLKFGFDQALKFWKPDYGKKFPAPAEIRGYCEQYVRVDPIADVRRRIASYKAVEEEWTPEERAAAVRELQERIVQAAAQKVMPYREITEHAAKERNGKSTMPADPVARLSWARQKAVETGWAEGREPGWEEE